MANNKTADLVLFDVKLMKGGQTKDCSLSHTGLGLTNNVTAQYRLGDSLMLHFTRMLKSSINDGTEKLGFQKEILESGCMNSDIVTSVRKIGFVVVEE